MALPVGNGHRLRVNRSHRACEGPREPRRRAAFGKKRRERARMAWLRGSRSGGEIETISVAITARRASAHPAINLLITAPALVRARPVSTSTVAGPCFRVSGRSAPTRGFNHRTTFPALVHGLGTAPTSPAP